MYKRQETTTHPVTTVAPVTTPAHETTTAATVAPTTQPVSTASPENVSEVRTTFSPAPDSYEETAPVMGERAFYN